MNLLQHYKRANHLAKHTSRMSNGDWYENSLKLDVQLHLYASNAKNISAYLFIKSKNSYEQLASINEEQFENIEFFENFVDRLLEREELKQAKSLGVIFYVADELSIASLGPEHQNPSELDDLKDRVISDPSEVLEDKTVSVNSHSWRVFPYRGAIAGSEFATTIVVSRKHGGMMALFRKIGDSKNFPIRTSVLSAPICAVASMPWFSDAHARGAIVVYNYNSFTLLAFFNAAGNLMMLRNMLHPSESKFPVNIGSAMAATSSAFELEGPEINVISMVGNDTSGLIASIQSGMKTSELMLIDSREILISRQLPSFVPLEMLVTTQGINDSALASNTTFSDLEEKKWHLQEFIIPPEKELAMFPSRGEMKLLRLGKIIRTIGAVAALLFASLVGFSVWKKTKTDSWKCEPVNQQAIILAFQQKMNDYNRYNNLFEDRSKAWVCMELFTKVAPANMPVHLSGITHKVDQQSTRGFPKVGFKKTWVIKGYTNDKGLVYLESISTKGQIEEVFNELATATGNNVYSAGIEGRDISIDIKNARNNSQRASQGSDWPLTFTMNITQDLPPTDKVALAGGK